MKKKWILLAAAVLAFALFIFANPVRAIKAGALMQGCDFFETISADFEKTDETGPNSWGDKYATDSPMLDRTTGSGHAAWYVHRILFLYIPAWAGNG